MKSVTQGGREAIHLFTHSSTVILPFFAFRLAWSAFERMTNMCVSASLPKNDRSNCNAWPSSAVNLQPYFTTREIASNPSGARRNILATSVRTLSWSFLKNGSHIPLLIFLTTDVSMTPGVSMTLISLSSTLFSHWHSAVTDCASAFSSKTGSPTILFPVALFPFPVLPRRTTVRGFPPGS